MTRKMLGMALGTFGIAVFVAAAAFGDGPSIGIGFGGGGGGYHGGGYGGGYGGYHGGSGVRFGLSVPLSNDGSVRLGVGNGGYYPSNYHNRYYYPHADYGYGGDDYYRGDPNYSAQPRGVRYLESTPTAPPEPPPVPTAGQVSRLSDDQLGGLLRTACNVFLEDLDGFTTGESWKKHFKLAEIIELAKKPKPTPLDAAARTMLDEVLKRLDSAAKNSEYDIITNSWGFKSLQVGLREYALPSKARQGHLLCANLQKLTDSLDGVTTGAGWKKHLQIEELEKITASAGAGDSSPNKQMEKILAKFDAVAQNPQYQVIAELDGFDSSRAALQRCINAPQADPLPQTPPPPPPAASIESVRSF